MIHVERTRIPPPDFLLKRGAAEHKKAEKFYATPFEKRSDARFVFSVFREVGVRNALEELFYRKCAFCESKVGKTSRPDIEHFRPKRRAVNLEGELFPDLYWWLASEWKNLYLSCQQCNRLKGTRFPLVDESARATAPGEEAREKPLLLDPCDDHPEEHLVFGEDGTVASVTERGRATIEIYGLNRSDLVEQRRRHYDDLLETYEGLLGLLQRDYSGMEKLRQTISEEVESALASFRATMQPDQAFAGLARQFVGQWIEEIVAASAQEEEQPEEPDGPDVKLTAKLIKGVFDVGELAREMKSQRRVWSKTEQQATHEQFHAYQQEQESYTMGDREHEERYFAHARLIERIHIRNFRVLEDLTLEVPRTAEHRTKQAAASDQPLQPWLMMLGENGTGKSSVLQALTLALIGKDYRARLGLTPADVLRYGEEEGEVKIDLIGAPPITLTFRKGAKDFESEPEEPKILLLAYGATRLLPRTGATPAEGKVYARVDNLFDPFVPLIDATAWLIDLYKEQEAKKAEGRYDEKADTFLHVRRALKNLLGLERGDTIKCLPRRRPTRVEIKAFGMRSTLDKLSDGYQTITALGCDIMAVMLDRWGAAEIAEGLVLIDEIGSHLHPRWQMRIVQSLREVFPRVQFLVTTHNPLCLRGLAEGELVVMRRADDGTIVPVTDLPPVEGLRVDQLLTSEHFGLESTIDPGLDDLYKEYYELLAAQRRARDRKKRFSKAKRTRLAQIKTQLDEVEQLGATRRERVMLEAVDEYLAEEPELLDLDKRLDLKKETREKVMEALGGLNI